MQLIKALQAEVEESKVVMDAMDAKVKANAANITSNMESLSSNITGLQVLSFFHNLQFLKLNNTTKE